uniref:Uncharacterized protein LOC105852565 n=1 Tax=Cicer arietinum TaxID=3827 RepID=A0A1S3EDU0_CICAR|nr:uncharacterized protein LOC105852565 [Cicer arietinum]
MQAYLDAQVDDIWDAVENGPYVPKTVIDNKKKTKTKASWTYDNKRKVMFDKKAKNILQSKSFRKKDVSTSSQNFTFFECGKQGHIKEECPNIVKQNALKNKEFKKTYIAWEDNDVSSSSDSETDECANVVLMTSHQFDEEEEDDLEKFDEKVDECIFIGYSLSSKAFIIFNKRTLLVEESMHVSFDESNPLKENKIVFYDDDDFISDTSKDNQDDQPTQENEVNIEQQDQNDNLPKEWRTYKDHPVYNIIGNIN